VITNDDHITSVLSTSAREQNSQWPPMKRWTCL